MFAPPNGSVIFCYYFWSPNYWVPWSTAKCEVGVMKEKKCKQIPLDYLVIIFLITFWSIRGSSGKHFASPFLVLSFWVPSKYATFSQHQECLRPLYTSIQWNEIYTHAFFFDYSQTDLQSLKEALKPIYIPQQVKE